MHLLIGLGNPGKKYEHTRHNLGFRVIDLLTGGGGYEQKYESEFLKLDDVILAKPQTFMNNSGQAVKEIMKFYPAAKLVVIHDELDFPVGTIKIMKNISGAGHNGVQSIIDELGTKDFIRVRLGINNPAVKQEMPSESFVLQNFHGTEEQLVNEVLEKAKQAVETLMTEGLDIAQSKFNG